MDIEKKVHQLLERLDSIEEELSKPETLQDQKKYRTLSQDHSYLSNVKSTWEKLRKAKLELAEAKTLLKQEDDPEFITVLEEEITSLEKEVPKLDEAMETLLIPPDPQDHANTVLEIRAGTGGDEAALFVGDCVRMYKMFSEKMGWKWESLTSTESDRGGFKEYIAVVGGPNVYRHLKHEGGTHRVQRIPDTETQGRIHTSAITVATLVEPGDDDDIQIEERDLEIDTYRASGAGGQHVNTTDSAVRITHVPTGVVVTSQEERSQHKNKEKCMRVLKARVKEAQDLKKRQELDKNRSEQVGSGDRSERIRTYNFPQNRVTDHRINLTTYDLDAVMEGELDNISNSLVKHFRQKELL